MAKSTRPVTIERPSPADERPAWSRVGIVAAVGFVLGIAWPKLAGVKVGPNVPGDLKAQAEVTAPPTASAQAAPAAPPPTAAPTAEPAAAPPPNKQTVVVGPGKISRCWDKKNKKVTDCGALQLDPVAVPKLQGLAECPSAVGLAGKLTLGLEIDFEKKEVHVVKNKKDKTTIPTSTVTGIVQCASRAFANLPLEDVPNKYRHYTVQYGLTFYPPGKAPEEAEAPATGEGEDAAGSTTSEAEANGTGTVSWDTALVRKDPKDGEVVVRLVRGTKVKIVGRRNDWFKIETNGKTGWIYRGAIGL
ncbi:SH3 domain-containing protein [Polyangium jinanense]|uniref:SH3 domain-containing protein n=1 Tax=Polyangium jinanense TaxID=2829994 RepID=A0A9X3X8D6_9BACT|nr:SH3 domain-containing protein [Polyangium jinanense]MDC3961305.1 SH3 domain-containing protein [Polyangium jinanense]MDC3984063.1 SH3 domain-containing protein [Polyangium jinanense]